MTTSSLFKVIRLPRYQLQITDVSFKHLFVLDTESTRNIYGMILRCKGEKSNQASRFLFRKKEKKGDILVGPKVGKVCPIWS